MGFFWVPGFALSQIKQQGKQYGLAFEASELNFNPFSFKAALKQLELNDLEGNNLLSCNVCTVDFSAFSSLFGQKVAFSEVQLDGLALNIEQDSQGEINWVKLIPAESESPSEPTSEPLRVSLDKISLNQASINYREARAIDDFTLDLEYFDLDLSGFDSLGQEAALYKLSFGLSSGGEISAQGDFHAVEKNSQAQIKISDLQLPSLWAYQSGQIGMNLTEGMFLGQFDLSLDFADALRFQLTKGQFEFNQLSAAFADKQSVFATLNQFKIDDLSLDSSNQSISIEQLQLNQGAFALEQTEQGIDVLGIVPKQQEEPVSQIDGAATEQSWQLTINSIQLLEQQVRFTDKSAVLSTPAEFVTLINRAEIGPYREQAPILISADLSIEPQASLNLQGEYELDQQVGEFQWTLDSLSLALVQAYLEETQIEIRDGLLNSKGSIGLSGSEQILSGQLEVLELALLQQSEELVKASRIGLDDFNLALPAQEFSAQQLILEQPEVFYSVKDSTADETIQTDTQDEEQSVDSVESEQSDLPLFSIASIQISEGALHFSDASVSPVFKTNVNEFSLSLDGLSNNPPEQAKLNAQARVDGYAPLSISGSINPFGNGETEIVAGAQNLELTSLGAYSDQFLGRLIDKGKLNLELNYKLAGGRLDAKNEIVLRQIQLGGKTDSEDALSLPLDLALALLRESSGDVRLDLNIKGDLNDPKFSVPGAILRVFLGLITKVATSPFSILGALLPNPDQDLSVVQFESGLAVIDAEQREKLTDLAQALSERSGLSLEIQGRAFGSSDLQAMRESALEQRLAARAEDAAIALEQEYLDQFGSLPEVPDVIQMRAELLNEITIDPGQLEELAKKRSETVRSFLIETQPGLSDSIFLLTPKTSESRNSGEAAVVLNLIPA